MWTKTGYAVYQITHISAEWRTVREFIGLKRVDVNADGWKNEKNCIVSLRRK